MFFIKFLKREKAAQALLLYIAYAVFVPREQDALSTQKSQITPNWDKPKVVEISISSDIIATMDVKFTFELKMILPEMTFLHLWLGKPSSVSNINHTLGKLYLMVNI